MKIRFLLLLLFSLFLSFSARASSLDKLKNFIQQTHSAKAHFTQSVFNKSSKPGQESSGTMQFMRPGKFRWTYEKPYEQLIVGDGVKLWVFDAELNQVTVRKLDQAIGSSPAALLAGNNEIEKFFTLKDVGVKEGLEWLEATPKGNESTFESVRMGFGSDGLQVMELHDNFGQVTLIRFSAIERNPKAVADLFKFVPPKGADVIGE